MEFYIWKCIYFTFNISDYHTLPEAKYFFPFVCGDKYLYYFHKTFLSTNLDAKLGLVLILRYAPLHTSKGQSIKIAFMAIKCCLGAHTIIYLKFSLELNISLQHVQLFISRIFSLKIFIKKNISVPTPLLIEWWPPKITTTVGLRCCRVQRECNHSFYFRVT